MSKIITPDSLSQLVINIKESENILFNYTKNNFNPDGLDVISTIYDPTFPSIDENIVDKIVEIYRREGNECEVGILLYESLENMTPRKAGNPGYWTQMNHHSFYKYIAIRWPRLWELESAELNSSKYILDHWVQVSSSQSDLMRYPISGLWWSVHLSIDETRSDKYELTRVLFMNDTLRTRQLGTARFARHKPAIHAVLEHIQDLVEQGISLEKVANLITPYVNMLGGIRPLSYFDKEWFKHKLNDYHF